MTDEQFCQLRLSESECVCPRVMAEEHAGEMSCRVLVALPVPGEAARRDEMVEELNQLLAASGCRTAVLSSVESKITDENDPGAVFRRGAIFKDSQYLRALTRRLMTFDVLHLVCYRGVSFVREILPSLFLARFFGKKVVLDYRNPIIFGPRLGERFLIEQVWRLCDRVVVLSPFQRQLVSSFGGRAEYIAPGVDVDSIALRVVTNIQPRIAVIADLEKEHGVVTAVRAFKLVKQKYPRTEMTIIGTGSESLRLKDMITREKINGITFTGEVDGPRRLILLQQSELYLNCTSADHLSVATVEAFACGLPVLTTPISSRAGDVLRSRDNIILLPYNDPVGTAERIIELIENPELTERLSRNSRNTAQSYSLKQRTKEWTRLYRDLFRSHI